MSRLNYKQNINFDDFFLFNHKYNLRLKCANLNENNFLEKKIIKFMF